jgi:2',3'-cyclic-nucleotide 2'-phosphodiesterase/3'-nucleotidase/5'-nucleotidase
MIRISDLPKPQWVRVAVPSRPLISFLALILVLGVAGCAGVGALPSGGAAAAPSSAGERSADATELVLLGTTDLHGRIYPYDYYTGRETDHGLALLKPLIDSVRAAHPGRTYLFDSGDILQGNPLLYYYARGQSGEAASGAVIEGAPNPIIRAMNLMGYSAAAIGNHEFNYGIAHLDQALGEAAFPLVSANIFRQGTDEHAYLPYLILPHVVAEGDTIRIGVTGNTPPGVHVWDRSHVEGRLDFRDIVVSVGAAVSELREAGADLVVILSHGGFEGTSYDTASTGLTAENVVARLVREVPGIDVVFLGHTHRELADSTITSAANPHGVLVTQASNWARSLAVARVRLKRDTAGGWGVASKGATLLRPRAERADTAFLDSMRWEHERTVAYVNSVVGHSPVRWEATEARVRDTPILDFINEVMRQRAGTDLSATAAFTTGAAIPEGEITVADLAGLYIYDNTLRAVRITGAELRAFLEKSAEYYHGWPAPAGGTVTNFSVPGYNFDVVSGVDYTIDLSRPVGERITELTYQGAPVRPEQSFTMALNNYRQGGGGGYEMVAKAPVVYDRQEDIRELLIEEVRRRGAIRPEDYFRENWRIVPAEAEAEALVEQTRGRRVATVAPAASASVGAGGAGAGAASSPAAASSAPSATSGSSDRTRLRVVATNDLHGRLLPERYAWTGGREVGGAATLATYFELEREGFPGPTLTLDGGDLMQGTPLSNLTEGRAAIDYFNLAGYRGAAVGNHEFDWGVPVLGERMEEAEFDWLAANVFVAGTDTAPSWLRPTALVEATSGADTVRVGLIGLATMETPEKTMPAHVAGLDFRDGAAAIDRWVPELRRRGAEFVIVVAHAGAACDDAGSCAGEVIDWARTVRNRPDLIVAGHTHRVVQTRVNGIPIVEAGSYGTRYAVVDLERIGPDTVHAWVRGIPVTYTDRVVPDSAMAARIDRYHAEIGPRLAEVVTTLAEPLRRGTTSAAGEDRTGEYPLGRLIADAQRAAGGTELALMNNGGIRIELPAGPLTWGTLFELQPFGNRLVRLQLSGAALLAAAEHLLSGPRPIAHLSGATVSYDPARPAGSRVLGITLDSGEAVRDEGSYTITVNDFLAAGGDGFAMLVDDAEGRVEIGVTDLDALIGYLRGLPVPVRGPGEPRFLEIR